MRKTRLVSLGGACAVGVAVAILSAVIANRSGINRANWRKVRDGMTEADVTKIFGCPPGTYTATPVAPNENLAHYPPRDGYDRVWHGEGCTIVVRFDGQGRKMYGLCLEARQWYDWFPEAAQRLGIRLHF